MGAGNETRSGAPAFIDLEATGLSADSWPIEIGWAFQDGDAAATLIKPDDAWPEKAWSADAEALHGIGLDLLNAEGRACADVCDMANDALAGRDVYSDAPDWDGFWLMRLFKAGGRKMHFKIRDFGLIFAGAPYSALDEIAADAARVTPRTHRALTDARHLATMHRLWQLRGGA